VALGTSIRLSTTKLENYPSINPQQLLLQCKGRVPTTNKNFCTQQSALTLNTAVASAAFSAAVNFSAKARRRSVARGTSTNKPAGKITSYHLPVHKNTSVDP
jgi:hypothetical protein